MKNRKTKPQVYNYNRPRTEIYLYSSVDGKITATLGGNLASDISDIEGVTDGLNYILTHEEYDVGCDWVMTSGKSMKSVGWNNERVKKHKSNTKYVVVDSYHLSYDGCINIAKDMKKLVVITTNTDHPAYCAQMDCDNIIVYQKHNINFRKVFEFLWKLRCNDISIQAGGSLNIQLIRAGLVDRIHLIMMPCIIGGTYTPTIADGASITSMEELSKIKTLTLERCRRLPGNYVDLIYLCN